MRVQRALLSVSDKFGIGDFAKGLFGLGVELIATTGTRGPLLEQGLHVGPVSRLSHLCIDPSRTGRAFDE